MKLKQLRPFGPVRVLLLFGCVHRLAGQAGPASTLSIPWIMRGFEIIGKAPTDPRWTPDGQWIYFHWLAAGAVWNQPQRLYRVRAEGGAVPELLSAVQADSAGPWLAAGPSSPDRAFRAEIGRAHV